MKLFKVSSIHLPEHGMEQMIWCKNMTFFPPRLGSKSKRKVKWPLTVRCRHYGIYIFPFVWRWQLFCIWLRLWTSETLSAPESKSDARLTQNLFVGSQHASHLIYPPSLRLRLRCGGHPGLGSLHLSRSRMLLICRLSSIHLTRPRQCSHAHTLEELSSGPGLTWDLTAAEWRHGHDQALYSRFQKIAWY